MNKELAKRLECVKRTLADMQEVVNNSNEPTYGVQTITTNDWELLTRSIIDCETALDLNDSEPIENDWYGLFSNDYGYIRTDLIMDISIRTLMTRRAASWAESVLRSFSTTSIQCYICAFFLLENGSR